MAEVKWIKIVTDIFDDDKILLIESMPEADAIIVIWFKLLCLAGKQNNSGVFLLNGRIPYTDEMFATIFRRPISTVRLALRTFEDFGMVEVVNDTITIPKWDKHQQLDALEASKEHTRLRVQRYRERQKQLSDACNVTVTSCNADRIDKNREDKNRLDKNRLDKREGIGASLFTPPKLDEVREYAKEKNWTLAQFDPEYFVDFYTSKGWKVGKESMKDWKACARGWVAREGKSSTGGRSKDWHNPAQDYAQREYKSEDYGDDFFYDATKEYGGTT